MSALTHLMTLSALLAAGHARHITGIFGSEHFGPAVEVIERSQWGNVVPLFHLPLIGSLQHHPGSDPNIRLLVEMVTGLRESVLLLQRRQHQLYQVVLCSIPQAINCTIAVAPDFVSPFPSHDIFPGAPFFPAYTAGIFPGSGIPDGFFPGLPGNEQRPSGNKPSSASSSVVGTDGKETTTPTDGTEDKQPEVETVTTKDEGEKKDDDKEEVKEEEKEKETANETQ